MKESLADYHYTCARKLGLKAYNRSLSRGQNGNLPSLDEILKNVEIVSEVDLGIVEIPLKKIIGTNSHLRSVSFANNFMPILGENTEFHHKWKALCAAIYQKV